MFAGSAKWVVLSAAHGYCLTVKNPIQLIQWAGMNQVWGSLFSLVGGRCCRSLLAAVKGGRFHGCRLVLDTWYSFFNSHWQLSKQSLVQQLSRRRYFAAWLRSLLVLVLIGDTGQVCLGHLFGLLQLMASQVVLHSNPRRVLIYVSHVVGQAIHLSISAAFHLGMDMMVQVASRCRVQSRGHIDECFHEGLRH